ncbi:uncharacterized protein PHACADRAFT_203446 [Phanerochaete carnosa HHB-10118-sp]|uniref:Haloacid dehalogenase n=1 Tax=Phanerochaete carnosa (strain HHB-10118-sp) TaxID=650164 RepID=K5XB61_PHACS|nr:uncharacterized protein PHACADRAFT_203446 [Phanerochaete carnosa HHB-10118-sp]EKM60182.1 hypothetical protein PHACADRAFT_203446 [Phanerochaete carnosa HHB-10118-sp]
MSSTSTDTAFLAGVEVFFFDVIGTVLDWKGSVPKQLRVVVNVEAAVDWTRFVVEWRTAFWNKLEPLASEETVRPGAIDIIQREALDTLLSTPPWSHLGELWDDQKRQEAVTMWHKLNGWPDSSRALYALKKHAVISTLANGSVRQFVDIAKHADLPWDVVLTGELLGGYKPNPAIYHAALAHLSVTPAQCCMVAAHAYDVRAAGALGVRTVYVRRETEDQEAVEGQGRLCDSVRPKSEGGDVDLVVESLDELVRVVERVKGAAAA